MKDNPSFEEEIVLKKSVGHMNINEGTSIEIRSISYQLFNVMKSFHGTEATYL